MSQRRKAAALKYKDGLDAPVVSAHGIGKIADKIIETANDKDVPVVYNKELTDLLCNVDVGESIPYELYDAVAHIIAYITELDAKK